jgi:hypothetical protein
MHKPALVAALVAYNDGDVGGSLGGNVKARCVAWQVPVQIPANPYVTKLKRSCEAAAHINEI